MLVAIADNGSMAAGARSLGLVPSALSYRIRQLEHQLDVLIIDRRTGRGLMTEAGQELVKEARRLLNDTVAVANRVRRIASGWEPRLSIALDSLISRTVVLDLCAQFYMPFASESACPTQIKIRSETLSGTVEALLTGEADLALGVVIESAVIVGINSALLGEVPFVFAVAPHHALAQNTSAITDTQLRQHRAVAVADSARRLTPITIGLIEGQDVLTVPDIMMKLEAQVQGLGCGFLPETLVAPWVKSGHLVIKKTQRKARVSKVSYAWREEIPGQPRGRAIQWWLAQLSKPRTRRALLAPTF